MANIRACGSKDDQHYCLRRLVTLKRDTTYISTLFSADVLREAYQVFKSQIDPTAESEVHFSYNVQIGNDTWSQDSFEEFLADYRRGTGWVYFRMQQYESKHSHEMLVSVHGQCNDRFTQVVVEAQTRPQIEAVFSVFENHIEDSQLPTDSSSTKPTIFIGHGRSRQWRDLKDHLQDQHGYVIVAYEVGARAGHGIRDILEDMLKKSTFAILVMTGEDETTNDNMQPRLNVVHEAGLFQGQLGFSRAIMLLEEGTREFSNVYGIEQIRFSKGNIKETFGDVLATLKREFPVIQ